MASTLVSLPPSTSGSDSLTWRRYHLRGCLHHLLGDMARARQDSYAEATPPSPSYLSALINACLPPKPSLFVAQAFPAGLQSTAPAKN